MKLRNSLKAQKKKGRSLLIVHCDRFFFLIRKICLNWYHAIDVRLAGQARLIINAGKGRFFFSTFVEILGYNEDPETRQDATELEWGYIYFPRNERREFGKSDEYCKSLVFRFRWSLIYSLFKTLAQLQTSSIVEQFYFFPMRVTIKRTRTASQHVLHWFYSTQISMHVYGWISKRDWDES